MVSLIASVFGIALFARQYGVSCQKCHTVIPHLNEFGSHFLASGDRIPGISSGPGLPLAAKVNLVDSSADQGSGDGGAGLPRAIVDEIEAFTAGTIGARGSFFAEQYVLDGGMAGALREAWVSERVNPWSARVPLYVEAGSFTLPLPVDPETFRETAQHYAVFDQTVANNPFNFFDPQYGVKATIGNTLRGISAQVYARRDTMAFVSDAIGPITAGIYHYRGVRPDIPGRDDRFERTGYSVVIDAGKWTSESVLQTGWDSSAAGRGVASSGGFTQVRYAFDRRFFAIARYEGVDQDGGNGFARDGVVGLGYAPQRNARMTLEDVLVTQPRTTNTMNLQVTVGI